MKLKASRGQENLSDQVRRSIEESILSGKYRAYEKLPTESEFCQLFGVSRTVIREALNKLKSEGFLQSTTRRGTIVLPYDFSNVNTAIERFRLLNTDKETSVSLLQLRTLIELECAEQLAKKPKPVVTANLRRTVEEMSGCLEEGSQKRSAFNDLDALFHKTLIQSSNNAVFSMLFDVLRRTISYPFDQDSFPISMDEIMKRTCRDHAHILECIENQDPEGVRVAIRSHLDYATELYVSADKFEEENVG